MYNKTLGCLLSYARIAIIYSMLWPSEAQPKIQHQRGQNGRAIVSG